MATKFPPATVTPAARPPHNKEVAYRVVIDFKGDPNRPNIGDLEHAELHIACYDVADPTKVFSGKQFSRYATVEAFLRAFMANPIAEMEAWRVAGTDEPAP